MKEVFNLDALVSVEIFDKQLHGYLVYRPAKKKTFWSPARTAAFYDMFDNGPYSPSQLEEGKYHNIKLLCVGESAYEYPRVTLTFAGGKVRSRKFSTYEKALEWGTIQSEKGIQSKLVI